MSSLEEVKNTFKKNQELIDEITAKIAVLDQRIAVIENNRKLGSDLTQRRKFLEDSLPRPAHRVVVSKAGDVYRL